MTSYFRKTIRKLDFPRLLDDLFASAITMTSISGGFRRAGVWPFNEEAMKDKVIRHRAHRSTKPQQISKE